MAIENHGSQNLLLKESTERISALLSYVKECGFFVRPGGCLWRAPPSAMNEAYFA
jgi:hypothetical protein